MSRLSSSSSTSSVSFLDPSSYHSTFPHTAPFGYHPNPDHYNTMKDCFDLNFYSSSFPNQFVMRNTSIFNSSSSSSSSSSGEYLDFNSSPVRHVFSTGDDLQGMNGLQASSNETQASETGTITCKVGRYSAEEGRERIQRYRSKRQQRNFQKKITYACRKTLADSRPRVKGRFARNGENETEMEMESEIAGPNYENFVYNNNYNCNVYSQSENNCTSTGTRDWQEELSYEEVFWPNMVDIFSSNLLS
ncbi:zinc finger CONSTANS-like protein [Rhynchospora pubera]|uniref:Zinc finger CONSTANS-like protein n=1 Tax=Rhynchospora pubera TaxID=906938 RepID=A0AAV8C792_9POAL|nr:zinc finger CONSTANS-like protein [Rhynchospora pubera]